MGLAHRLREPITVVTGETGRPRLVELPEGAVVLCKDSSPDTIGIVEGRYRANHVLVFLRGLDDRAVAVAAPLRRIAQFKTQQTVSR